MKSCAEKHTKIDLHHNAAISTPVLKNAAACFFRTPDSDQSRRFFLFPM
jgi:hypothetical protein